MDLHYYLGALGRRSLLIVLAVVGAAAVAWVTTPQNLAYSATSTIYVGPRQFQVTAGKLAAAFDPTIIVARLLNTYSQMLASPPTAAEAIRRAQVPRSPAQVVAETHVDTQSTLRQVDETGAPIPDTQLLTVTVTDLVPTVAQSLANGLADVFVQRIQAFNDNAIKTEGVPPGLPAYVFERAVLPTVPNSSPLVPNMVIGVVLALLASCTIILAFDRVDISMRTPEQTERILALPVLGVIPLGEPADA